MPFFGLSQALDWLVIGQRRWSIYFGIWSMMLNAGRFLRGDELELENELDVSV